MREAYPYGMWLSMNFVEGNFAKSKWYDYLITTLIAMIYDEKQGKYFYEDKWLTAQECTNGFLEQVERNQIEMDASPNKAFYDSVCVASGGERVKEVIFGEKEIKDLLVQLESDIREGIDESLILGPTQYSTKERTFMGGKVLTFEEFKEMCRNEPRRKPIQAKHRMRFRVEGK